MAREGRAYRTSTVHGTPAGMVAVGVDTEAAREPRCLWPLSARRHAAANAAPAEALGQAAVEGQAPEEEAAPALGSFAARPRSPARQMTTAKRLIPGNHNDDRAKGT